ncbi:DUF5819 family protein [Streptomyces sp. Tu 3180]|uniref:DUF5819 family protein n=1 Tax=Streptomyces sp. Tu 3180 TaxID=2682611 RepID=UPI00135AD55D|nr:DUF5819 family protein [Streptomyces sp. Tu 3180]KAF3466418.1 hypothetical protein GL259_20235 [Streptomyces sp. Tu 3180]
MDAYDEGSDARHGPAGPGPRRGLPGPPPAPDGPADAPDDPVDVPDGPADAPDDPVDVPDGPADAPDDPVDVPDGPADVPDDLADSPGGPVDAPGRRTAPHAPAPPADIPPAPLLPAAGPGRLPAGPPPAGPPDEPRTGVAALSLRYQIGAAVALAAVAAGVCVHLGMTFLHVAPANTVSKEHGETIEDWIYPEFEQNWKLFAPNPLQQNIAVQVRAEIRTADGGVRTTGWYDLSAQDGRAIDGNPLPSHTQQNELRRAWDFFLATHDGDNRPAGPRGTLSEAYLRRITVLRLDRADAAGPGGLVERVQIRSRTTNVAPPEWSEERVSTTPVYRTLPWWPVPEDEARGGVG